MLEFPLHEAARGGDVVTLKALIDSGRDVNVSNFDAVTPLHDACLHGRTECARLLLASGATVNARNIDGSTPLCDACNGGNIMTVRLLLDHGAHVNPALNPTTPLHEAVLADNAEIVALLVECGARLEASDLHFGTPLHAAAYKNHVTCARILLTAGAGVNAAKTHQTALHMACINHSADMCAALLEFGANVHAENQWGRKPCQIVSCRSPLYRFLKNQEGMPRRLQDSCRLVIRRSLCVHGLRHIKDLPLPKYLIQYLQYT